MSEFMKIYNSIKGLLGDEIPMACGISRREFREDSWLYVVYYVQGTPAKIEASNHREFIELWNK